MNLEIQRALRVLFKHRDVVELRAPKTRYGTQSGYFNNSAALAACAEKLDAADPTERVGGVYVTINPLKPALLARCENRIKHYAELTTADRDIARRHYLLVDIDPQRPAGVSSTDAEHELALQQGRQIARWLCSMFGWPQPIIANSGNGAHLLYRIDLPNDGASAKLVEGVLAALDFRFSTADLSIDTAVGNAARIVRLYGTWSRKGDNTSERPHRQSRILDGSTPLGIVTVEQLNAVAGTTPAAQSIATPRLPKNFDLPTWLRDQAVPVGPELAWNGGSKRIIRACPFNSEHKDSAYIVQFASGAIAAGCHHNSCRQYKWPEFRKFYEPTYIRPNGEVSAGSDPSVKADADDPTNHGFISASELLTEPTHPETWVVDGMFAEGGYSLLLAKPKVGKSTLAQNLALAVARGTTFLGRATKQGTVLYLALEERRSLLRRHFRALGLTDADPIHFYIASTPQDANAWLERAVAEYKPALVIIDTLQRFTRMRDINDW